MKHGRKQAEETREKLTNMPIDLIICSPLIRAKETADIINKGRNIPIVIDERAIERNLGIYEGMPNSQEIFNEIRYYTKNVPVQDGEDCQSYTKRVFEFLDDVIKKYKGKYENVLICSHGFFLRSASWYFNGIPGENEEVVRIKNCQVDVYEV
ncbi:MAG: histidine phosphatase family protein [Clostridia bacterium]|nr:histidine phosphatase family protein [Clostridia bacterium]